MASADVHVYVAVLPWTRIDLKSVTESGIGQDMTFSGYKFKLGFKKVIYSDCSVWHLRLKCPDSCPYPLSYLLNIKVNTNYYAAFSGTIKGRLKRQQILHILPDMFTENPGRPLMDIELYLPLDPLSGEKLELRYISMDIDHFQEIQPQTAS